MLATKIKLTAILGLFGLASACGDVYPAELTLYYCEDRSTADCNANAGAAVARIKFERTKEYSFDKPDEFCAMAAEKVVGNDQTLEIWTNAGYSLTAFPDGSGNIGLRGEGVESELTCLRAGQKIYVRSCVEPATNTGLHLLSDAADCTQYFEALVPDDRTQDYDTNDRYRIPMESRTIPTVLSCIVPNPAGVETCYDWDRREFLLTNASDTAVHLTIDVPERASTYVDAYYLVAGAQQRVASSDVQEGDTARIRAWVGYLESVIDRLRDEVPHFAGSVTVSLEPEWVIQPSDIVQRYDVSLARVAGVQCVLSMVTGGEGSENLQCENGSTDEVEIALYALKPSDGTTYDWDYEMASFVLLNAEVDEASGDYIGAGQTAFALITNSFDLTNSNFLRTSYVGFSVDLTDGTISAIASILLPAEGP